MANQLLGSGDWSGSPPDVGFDLSISGAFTNLTTQSATAIAGLDGLSSAFERLTQRAIKAAEAVGGFGGAAAGLSGFGAEGAGPAEQVAETAQQFEALGSGLAGVAERSETAAQAVDRLAKSTAGSGSQARAMGADVKGARGEVDDFAAAGKKAGDEVVKSFERAGEGIKQSFADSFAELIEKGRFSFDRLAGSVRDIFKNLALELARTLIIRPVLGSIAGAFGLNALVTGKTQPAAKDGFASQPW